MSADLVTLPLGPVAVELSRLLWRGILVHAPGDAACFLPWRVLDGRALDLANRYDAFAEWILADPTDPMERVMLLPAALDFPRIRVWIGASPADVAAQIAANNEQIAGRILAEFLTPTEKKPHADCNIDHSRPPAKNLSNRARNLAAARSPG